MAYKKVTEDGVDYIEIMEIQTFKRLIPVSELAQKKEEIEEMIEIGTNQEIPK